MAVDLATTGLNDATVGNVADTMAPKNTFLTQRVGFLPVWGWGAVLIGGAILGLFVIPRFMGKGTTNVTATDTSGTDTSTATGAAAGTAALYPWQVPISTGPTGPQGPQGPQGAQGTPGPQGTPGTPGTTTKPATAKPAGQWITVKPWPGPDSTLSGIAQHYYGNAAKWPTIYQANRAAIGANPDLIQSGAKLWVPAL